MIIVNSKIGDVLRRASKLTAALQVFSVGLLVVLIFLYMNISAQQAAQQDSVRENAIWSVFQLDREAHTLESELDIAVAGRDTSEKSLKRLSLRYDILYSRADLLKKSRFQDFFTNDKEIAQLSLAVRDAVFALDPLFKELQKSPTALARMQRAEEPVAWLTDRTNALLLATNQVVSNHRAKIRDDISALEHTSAIYLILLLISVAFLIFTLRRQLGAVREAGRGFEIMAKDLSNAYDAADAGNRAKSQFMATMGHEIRTPLNAILGTAELLELSNLPPDIHENVTTIRSSGEALLEVLNEILDYSKIEYGKLEIELRPANIEDLARNAVGIMRGRAAERGDSLLLDLPQQFERPWVKTDPTRLRQVILNLASNAIKFTDHGKVTLRIREKSGPNGACILRVEVMDSGIGISPNGQQKLFKPFSQVDASISRRFGGTGLGLTISKEIISRLGGEIGVESEIGKGSTFWFEIPAQATAAPPEVQRSEAASGLEQLTPRRILVVEDNRVNQQIALRFLKRLGQSADVAADGEEAVRMANNHPYDIILMDMQMPVMDGIQAAREIRNGNGPNARSTIIAMTANASDDDRKACDKAGMNGFEAKPISLRRFHAIVAAVNPCGQTIGQPDLSSHMPTSDAHREAVLPMTSSIEIDPEIGPETGSHTGPDSGLDPARRHELVEALGEELFEEILESFFNDAQNLLGDIETAMKSQDAGKTDAALHTLKGAAANVGFKSVAELAQKMRETDAALENFERLNSLITDQQRLLAA